MLRRWFWESGYRGLGPVSGVVSRESLTSIRNGSLGLGVRVGVEQPTEGNYYQNGAIHFERRLLADSGARGAGSFLFIVVILVAVVLACVTYGTRKYFHCFACWSAASRALARFGCS